MRLTTPLLAATMMAGLSACAPRVVAPPPATAPTAAELEASKRAAATGTPDLLVVISVDQLSSALMEEYLPMMSGGLARLANQGTLFLDGYQAQSATETCPGHATILTGALPARSGIVANNWYDLSATRENKRIYCAEDENAPLPANVEQVISPEHLLVPTLGTYLKRADARSRNVAIAGKDRSAVMLGGHDADQRWWWGRDGWTSDLAAPAPSVVSAATVGTRELIDGGSAGLSIPEYCASKPVVEVENRGRVGNDPLGWRAGDFSAFRASPAYDGAVLALGAALIDEMELGQAEGTDLISLGLSATDYVGHKFGPQGGEMCLQMFGLDQNLGGFLNALDARDLDYAVVLTSDHGALPIPERLRLEGNADAARLMEGIDEQVRAHVEAQLDLPENWLVGSVPGDLYLDPGLDQALAGVALETAYQAYQAHPQIAHVTTGADLAVVPIPTGDPRQWTIQQRLRATYHPQRSGDLIVVLKEWITPISNPAPTYISTHGSPYEYDRRVPIIFYRPGQAPLRREDPARTVDILPTLAAHLRLSLGGQEIDGVCLDGVHGVRCAR